MTDNLVLSHSVEQTLLLSRESALRSFGYKVISETAAVRIRYEIEFGQCGVLVLCYTVHEAIRGDLAQLFARHCTGGVIVSVMHPSRPVPSSHAHICLQDSDFPDNLHLIKKVRDSRKTA